MTGATSEAQLQRSASCISVQTVLVSDWVKVEIIV